MNPIACCLLTASQVHGKIHKAYLEQHYIFRCFIKQFQSRISSAFIRRLPPSQMVIWLTRTFSE